MINKNFSDKADGIPDGARRHQSPQAHHPETKTLSPPSNPPDALIEGVQIMAIYSTILEKYAKYKPKLA